MAIDEDKLDTPFIRRYRAKVEQARIETYRITILEAVSQRLDPPVSIYRQMEQKLVEIEQLPELQELFTFALQAESIDNFIAVLTARQP